jgi:replicative DNA helicase
VEEFVPYDARLEQEIIGCMIYDPACVADVIEMVKPQHFYIQNHRVLCQEIYRLWQQDENLVNLTELAPFLQKEGIKVSDLSAMVDLVTSTRTVRHHAERLKLIASLRAATELGREMASKVQLRDRTEIRETLNRFEQHLSQITESSTNMQTMTHINDALLRFNDWFDRICERGAGITGIPTGFDDLDAITAGYQKQDLIILAARPSMGKTAFALASAIHMGQKVLDPILFFELEMKEEDLIKRMIANKGMVDIHRITMGDVDEELLGKVTFAQSELSKLKLVLDTQPGITIQEMKAKARRLKREHGLSCIIVDYISLIPGERGMTRYETVSENTRQLKNMARELNVPVIALAQLSRGVEQRQDKRPMLSDLRESGEIEQTADLVMFLYRDDYYHTESDKKNVAEVIVAKHRNGPTGKVEMLFLKEYGQFLPLTWRDER